MISVAMSMGVAIAHGKLEEFIVPSLKTNQILLMAYNL
jgi:hypothetical protein